MKNIITAIGIIALGSASLLTSAHAQNVSAASRLNSSPITVYRSLPGKFTLTEMQQGHSWTTNTRAPFSYQAVSGPIIGHQHFRAQTSGDGVFNYSQAMKLKRGINIRNKNLAILIRVDRVENWEDFQVFLGNNRLTDYRKYPFLLGHQGAKWFTDGQWTLFTMPLNVGYKTIGKPKPFNIDSVRIGFKDNGTDPIVFDVQAVALFDSQKSKPASVMFDGGHASIYEKALPILEKAGMAASVSMPHNRIGKRGFLTKAQLLELQNQHGWEIVANAPKNDMRNEGENTVRRYLSASRAYWQPNGFDVSGFVYPGGEHGILRDNPWMTVKKLVKNAGFSWARTINHSVPETLPIADPYKIRPVHVTNANPSEEIAERIDDYLKAGGWPIVVLQKLVDGEAMRTTEYKRAEFEKIVEKLASVNADMTTPSTLLEQVNGL